MDDLISRADAVTEIHKYFVEEIDKTPVAKDEDGDEVYTDMPTVNSLLKRNKELSKRIKALPSAELKTGKWIQKDSCADRFCSCCDYVVWDSEAEEYNYCSNCGAKMRGKQND